MEEKKIQKRNLTIYIITIIIVVFGITTFVFFKGNSPEGKEIIAVYDSVSDSSGDVCMGKALLEDRTIYSWDTEEGYEEYDPYHTWWISRYGKREFKKVPLKDFNRIKQLIEIVAQEKLSNNSKNVISNNISITNLNSFIIDGNINPFTINNNPKIKLEKLMTRYNYSSNYGVVKSMTIINSGEWFKLDIQSNNINEAEKELRALLAKYLDKVY